MRVVGAYIRASAQYFVIWPIETAMNYQYFNEKDAAKFFRIFYDAELFYNELEP